jgi:hypothetical protein
MCVSNSAFLVLGFTPKLGFLADFLYISLISPDGNYRERDWYMGGCEGRGPRSAPLCVLMSMSFKNQKNAAKTASF